MSEAVARWAIERLAKHHDRSAFECGQRSLSDWIRQSAGQFMDRDLSRVYVAVSPGQSQVLGYYAISNAHIRPDDLPRPNSKRLPRHIDVPVALIGKLAVDRGVQGQGLGAFLLIDALRRIRRLADQIGILATVVDAIDGEARAFYKKYGFEELLDDPNHLFMTMRVVRSLDPSS